jgi:hypothetical protein
MNDRAIDLQLLADLRFALDVLEERSHLGLDAEKARLVRDVIRQKILRIEGSERYMPSSVKPNTDPAESITA